MKTNKKFQQSTPSLTKRRVYLPKKQTTKQLPIMLIQIAILTSTVINIANFSLQITRYLNETQVKPQPTVIELIKTKQ